MYPHVKKAVDEGKVLLEWDKRKGKAPAPLLKVDLCCLLCAMTRELRMNLPRNVAELKFSTFHWLMAKLRTASHKIGIVPWKTRKKRSIFGRFVCVVFNL